MSSLLLYQIYQIGIKAKLFLPSTCSLPSYICSTNDSENRSIQMKIVLGSWDVYRVVEKGYETTFLVNQNDALKDIRMNDKNSLWLICQGFENELSQTWFFFFQNSYKQIEKVKEMSTNSTKRVFEWPHECDGKAFRGINKMTKIQISIGTIF